MFLLNENHGLFCQTAKNTILQICTSRVFIHVIVCYIYNLVMAIFDLCGRSLTEICNAIPAHLFKQNTICSLLYFSCDLVLAAIVLQVATYINHFCCCSDIQDMITSAVTELGQWAAWCI